MAGTVLLLAAAPAGKGCLVDAASVLPVLAAVPPAVLSGTDTANVVELADPLEPQAVLTRLRAAAVAPGPLTVFVTGQLQLDRRQRLPHLALARTTPSTVRYTGLPWHWIREELRLRAPGTTSLLLDLHADAETWEWLRANPLDSGRNNAVYGRVAPPPQRRTVAGPAYMKAVATLLRSGHRPPLDQLHQQALSRIAPEAGVGTDIVLTARSAPQMPGRGLQSGIPQSPAQQPEALRSTGFWPGGPEAPTQGLPRLPAQSLPLPATDGAPRPVGGPVPLPAEGSVPLPVGGPVPLPAEGSVPLPVGGPVPLPAEGSVPLPVGGPVPLPAEGSVPLPAEGPVPLPVGGPVPLPVGGPVPLPAGGPVPLPAEGSVPLPAGSPVSVPAPVSGSGPGSVRGGAGSPEPSGSSPGSSGLSPGSSGSSPGSSGSQAPGRSSPPLPGQSPPLPADRAEPAPVPGAAQSVPRNPASVSEPRTMQLGALQPALPEAVPAETPASAVAPGAARSPEPAVPAPSPDSGGTPAPSLTPAPESSASRAPAHGIPPIPTRPPAPSPAQDPAPSTAPGLTRDPSPSPALDDPHAAIKVAVGAGRHGEADALAAHHEQVAMRAHGHASEEALHWIEVRADLAMLAGDPVRSCRSWLTVASARLSAGQTPDMPAVEAAVDRAHHQWGQIHDTALARELGSLLAELRGRVPGRRRGALANVHERLRQLQVSR